MRGRVAKYFLACITGFIAGSPSVYLQKLDDATLCNVGLGLESGSNDSFPPESFGSSTGEGAVQGRLKEATGAWCVAREDVENQAQSVWWWVDLGKPQFVTGHKAQGPPKPFADKDLGHTVHFQIHTSFDKKTWTEVESNEAIYSKYATTSPDDVTTVNWNAAGLGRYVRLTVDPSKFFVEKKACMRFELLGCAPSSTKLWTNIRISSTDTGIVNLIWNPPLLRTGGKEVSLTPDDYTSSYFLLDVADKPTPDVQTKTGGKTQLTLRNAYFGASYTFRIKCDFTQAGLAVDGGEISLSLYPTCPSNWFSSGPDCYHSQKGMLTWADVLRKCKGVFANPSQANPSDPIPEGTKTWLATKQSTVDDPQAESVCSVLVMSDNQTAVQDQEQCQASQSLPYACIFQRQVVFASGQNFVLKQIADQTVKVMWTEEEDGWRTLSKNVKTFDGVQESEWASYPSFGSSFTLTGLQKDRIYKVFTSPGISNYEHLQQDAFSIFITSSGVLTNVSLSAYVVWSGTIHLEWTQAVTMTKDDKSVQAESYVLKWTHASDAGTVPQPITKTSYDLDFPTFGGKYVFYLSCKFAATTIPCGYKELAINTQRISFDPKGPKLLLYIYNTEKLAWQKAEDECVKQGGHLASIKNDAEDKRVENLGAVATAPYWLGGTNCNGKITNWLDGTVWTYARPPIQNFGGKDCCLQVAAVDNNVYWKGADCASKIPYFCKFDLPVTVSAIQELTSTVLSSTQVFLQWKPPSKNWKPTYYKVQSCASGACTEMTRVATTPAAMVDGLAPGTAYTIKVVSEVQQLLVTNEAVAAVKTAPIPTVDYSLNSDGVMKLKWTRKVTQGKGGAASKVEFSPTGSKASASVVEGTANEIVITGFKLETEYSFKVTEVSGGDSDTFTAVIRPTCAAGHVQYDSLCFWPTQNDGKWSAVRKTCKREGGRLAKADEVKKQLLLGVMAKNKKVDLWIDGQEVRTDTIQVDAVKAATEEQQDTEAQKTLDTAAIETSQSGTTTDRTAELSKEIVDEGICQKMKRDTQDIMKDDCTLALPAICEKKVPVTLAPISGLKTTKVTEKSATITWSVPQSWQPTAYKVTLKQGGSRRKRATKLPTTIEVKENQYTTPELQPGTTYVVEVTPVVKQADSSVEGKTNTFNFATQKLTKPEATAAAAEAVQSDTKPDVAGLGNCSYPASLHTFHIIGCSTIVTLVSLSLIIFLACRMFQYRDSLAQINMEVALLIVHILILITVSSPDEIDFRPTSVTIHFFFMASFAFLTLECVCIAKAMTRLIPLKAFNKLWQIMAVGWGLPLLCIIFSAGFLYEYYPKSPRCWIDTGTDLLYSMSIPIGIFCVVAFLLLVAAFCLRPTENYEVDEESFLRERVLENTRWVMLLLLGLMTVSWSCGMVGTNSADESLLLIFIIFNILIGVCILILRCFGDAEVRLRMKQCCSGGTVAPAEEEPQIFLPTKEFPDPARFNKFTPPQTGFVDKNEMMMNRAYVFQP